VFLGPLYKTTYALKMSSLRATAVGATLTCFVLVVCIQIRVPVLGWIMPAPPASTKRPRWTALDPSNDMPHAARTQPHTPAQGRRTAVCVTGQLRTMSLSPHDPLYPTSWAPQRNRPKPPIEELRGMTAAESVQARFFPALGTFDVFMSISTRGSASEPAVGNLSVCEPLRPRVPGGKLFCEVIPEAQLPMLLPGSSGDNPSVWQQYIIFAEESNMESIQGLLQQLYSLHRCQEAIRVRELHTGVRYDYTVRLRPDAAFYDHMPVSIDNMDFGTRTAPSVAYVALENCCCGNEDSLLMGPRDALEPWMNRFLTLQSLPLEELGLSSSTMWNAETYGALCLSKMGVAMHPANITAC
jgi:hypothetical protein